MRPKKILLVDDEPEFVELVQMRLEANHYDVVTANTGEEALARAEAEAPNLVLLDVMMPGMDGIETLRKLRLMKSMEQTPIIMLTARGESRSIFKAQDSRVTDYLIKPCEAQDLLAMVKRYA